MKEESNEGDFIRDWDNLWKCMDSGEIICIVFRNLVIIIRVIKATSIK